MTLPIVIGYETARKFAEEVIAEYGADYVYEWVSSSVVGDNECMYFHPETHKPSCIVGQIIARAGITFDHLAPFAVNEGSSFITLVDKNIIKCDEQTRLFLMHLQLYQDDGITWGEAYKMAVETAEKTSTSHDQVS